MDLFGFTNPFIRKLWFTIFQRVTLRIPIYGLIGWKLDRVQLHCLLFSSTSNVSSS